MVLGRFRQPDKTAIAARGLYDGLVAQARTPLFHTKFAVPDTIDGRFDLLALHAFLVLEALKTQGQAGAKVGTQLASLIFAGFDDALRELGIGDMGISRRIKAMAGAFYGRLEAYRDAKSEAALAAAIERNLYRGEEAPREALALAHYMISAERNLRAEAVSLTEGRAEFGPLPEF